MSDHVARYRRWTIVFLALLLAGTVVGVAVPAGVRWDFANFYDTSRRAAAGQFADIYDPASRIAGEAPQGSMRFWGTPVSALFYAPLSAFAPPVALVVFKIQNTLALLAALLLLWWHNRRFVDPAPETRWRYAAGFALLSLGFQPLWTVYRVGGQSTPTVILLLALALIAHERGRIALTASLVVLAVAIKPAFLPVLGVLALFSGARFLAATAGAGLVLAAVGVAVMGWPVHQEFLALLRQGTAVTKSWVYNSALSVPFDSLRLLPEVSTGPAAARLAIAVASATLKLLALATLTWLGWLGRGRSWSPGARRHFVFLLSVLAFLFASAVLWEHYLAVLFFLIAYVWAAERWFSRAAVGLIVGVVAVAVGQNLVLTLWLRSHVAVDTIPVALGLGLWKAAPLLLTLVFLWRNGAEWLQSYAGEGWAAARG